MPGIETGQQPDTLIMPPYILLNTHTMKWLQIQHYTYFLSWWRALLEQWQAWLPALILMPSVPIATLFSNENDFETEQCLQVLPTTQLPGSLIVDNRVASTTRIMHCLSWNMFRTYAIPVLLESVAAVVIIQYFKQLTNVVPDRESLVSHFLHYKTIQGRLKNETAT